ncbi:hypothetical protein EJB05_01371, partial [Eragrostis curvula]
MKSTSADETATSSIAAIDLISSLHDDLLLRILSFLPAASKSSEQALSNYGRVHKSTRDGDPVYRRRRGPDQRPPRRPSPTNPRLPAGGERGRADHRTVLSRRWRRLWPNAVALRFTVGKETKDYRYTQADRDDAGALIAAATAVLSRRFAAADCADVEVLDLSFVYSDSERRYIDIPCIGYQQRHYHAVDITSAHVAEWLLFAQRHVTRRFKLTVPTVPKKERRPTMPQVEEEEDDEGDDDAEEEDDDEENDTEGEEDEEDNTEEDEDEEEDCTGKEDGDDGIDGWKSLPEYEYDDEQEEERVLHAEFPSSMRAEEMTLTLGHAILKVPAAGAGAFRALTDLLLSHATLDASPGDDHRLSHLLSSSCSPRLRRLRLQHIKGITKLRLNVAAGALEELQLVSISSMWLLEVDAPRLRILGVKGCYHISSARIFAPRLEVLACHRLGRAERLRFDGATSVRRVEELHVSSHRLRQGDNDAEDEDNSAVWLLRHCTAADTLHVEVKWPDFWPIKIDEAEYEDNVVHIPPLPNIINLRIGYGAWPGGHAVGATLAKLIAKCTEIETLSIDMMGMTEDCSYLDCICNHPMGWEEQKISLQNLTNVEIHNFLPYDGPMGLVRLLLTNASALERMTIAQQMIPVEGRELVDFHIRCYGGCWVPCDWSFDRELGITWATKYEWTRVSDSDRSAKAFTLFVPTDYVRWSCLQFRAGIDRTMAESTSANETATSCITATAVDLISGLHDDLLLRILSFLPAASEVARTAVLSRRWRHLWPKAVALRFAVGSEPKDYHYTQADRDDARALIAAATATLRRRASADVEALEVSLVYTSNEDWYIDDPYIGYHHEHYHAVDVTSAHLASWLAFAARRVTGRLVLAVPTVPRRRPWTPVPEYEYKYADEREAERELVAELPSSARVREMSLTLGKATLKLPLAAAGAFLALTDVLLSHARLAGAGDGNHCFRLGNLFSSSCAPRLRRLQLKYVEGVAPELRLDAAETLEELRLLHLRDMRGLDVAAPGLRDLGVEECFWLNSVRLSAPRLEVMACEQTGCVERLRFDAGAAASLRRIELLQLSAHWFQVRDEKVKDDDSDSAAVWFLRHCTAVDRLGLEVMWPQVMSGEEEVDYEDNMMRIPQLPNIRNLKIKFDSGWSVRHTIGATAAKLIAKCSDIEDLSIETSNLVRLSNLYHLYTPTLLACPVVHRPVN